MPTPFGAEVLAYLERGFRELTRGVALAQEPKRNLLDRLGGPGFAAKWLVWRLPHFQKAHPDLQVRIDASIELVDLDHSDVDLAIRVGPGNWPNVKAELLLEQRVFPVCAPALAGRLKTPRDLAKVPIIHDRPDGHFQYFSSALEHVAGAARHG